MKYEEWYDTFPLAKLNQKKKKLILKRIEKNKYKQSLPTILSYLSLIEAGKSIRDFKHKNEPIFMLTDL